MSSPQRKPLIPYDWPNGTSPHMKATITKMAREALPGESNFMLARWLQKYAWGIIRHKEMHFKRIPRLH